MATPFSNDSRLFLLEIAIASPVSFSQNQVSIRSGKIFLKVPYARMSAEIRNFQRLGAKILSITPTSALDISLKPLAWWVEIYTDFPRCLYYFGPFNSDFEAKTYQGGYIEDLQQEGAEGIVIQIKQCQPINLTQEW
ncbi:MAG: DUF1816 domain-containing protein [Snowella sp.]|nr:DUF1816 domain-containing protein [Snowella sp.]